MTVTLLKRIQFPTRFLTPVRVTVSRGKIARIPFCAFAGLPVSTMMV